VDDPDDFFSDEPDPDPEDDEESDEDELELDPEPDDESAGFDPESFFASPPLLLALERRESVA
jgi:hypothetical protein